MPICMRLLRADWCKYGNGDRGNSWCLFKCLHGIPSLIVRHSDKVFKIICGGELFRTGKSNLLNDIDRMILISKVF